MTTAKTGTRPEAAVMLSHWWSRPVHSEVAAWDDEWLLACRLAEDVGLEPQAVGDLAAARRARRRTTSWTSTSACSSAPAARRARRTRASGRRT